ncbi:MFS transporter [Streptomyces sp. DSM 44917]|uniref:MFS transporter n=1 Tax=Streptomyces boetiae TaxID=3075541 RepID=A0ABU2LC38_9ACTN|nr:MFS transporter [Streptomyces sp. DSM 44917]MDT0308872.1 MFS transporter [Streptomyces sp. DSM 44917]
MAQAELGDQGTAGAPAKRRAAALTVLVVGMLMDLLDTSIVNVALPEIQADLDASSSALQWTVAGYALPFAIGMITGGRLGDLFGRKRIFIIGLALFVLTSLLTAVAQTGGQLVGFRVAQGVAAALMVPQVIATIQVMYAPHERARPLTVAASMYAISAMTGPFLGALLTESDIAGMGWRMIFLVNIPVGIVVLIAAVYLLPDSKSETATRLDLTGMILAAVALLLLLYPLAVGHEEGWPLWTFICMALSLPALAIFVMHQRGQATSPLLPIQLFRHRSFTGGLTILVLGFATVYGFFLAFTVYLQTYEGYSIMRAGVALIWWGLVAPIFGGLALNVLGPRFGRRVVQVGLLVMILALFSMMLVMNEYGPDAGSGILALPMVLGGIGGGLSLVLVVDYAISDVPVTEAGSASGVLNAVQQVGAAIGVSAVGALFFDLVPEEMSPTFQQEASDAFGLTMILPICMVAVALVASFLLPRRVSHPEAPPTTVEEPVTAG